MTLHIRPAKSAQEVKQYFSGWANQEHWNPGLNDALAFFEADTRGFFIAEKDGEVVSIVSGVATGLIGFIGHYICTPAQRGKGFGLDVFKAGMTHLVECETVGLDGVLAQVGNYRKSGFQVAWTTFRMQGTGIYVGVDSRVNPLSSFVFDDVVSVDKQTFGAERTAFLRHWLSSPGVTALGITDKHTGKLIGYGVMRPARDAFRVGPLFAENQEDAQLLFDALISHAPTATIHMDTPVDTGNNALTVPAKHGFKNVFEVKRMYTNGIPKTMKTANTWGCTTLELG